LEEGGGAGLGGADDEEVDAQKGIVARRVPITDPTRGERSDLTLRPASAADAGRLREWRNDPEVRASSRNTGEIGAAEHDAWLAAALADPEVRLLICELGGEPVGQVRFDRRGERRYEISVALAAGVRGRGLAATLISMAMRRLRESCPEATVEAHVREANHRSLAAFRRAGFGLTGKRGDEGFVVLLAPPGVAPAS
jgi:RimJ/RimL family protein N-acetyltransferase